MEGLLSHVEFGGRFSPLIALPWQTDIVGTFCLDWVGRKQQGGRGRYGNKRSSSTTLAHRYLYEEWVGEIADGLELDHLCARPICVNPLHMEPVSRAENVRRRNALVSAAVAFAMGR